MCDMFAKLLLKGDLTKNSSIPDETHQWVNFVRTKNFKENPFLAQPPH